MALVAVGWLWGPGLPVGCLLGLRGIAAFAMAPVISVAVIAAAAVVAGSAGVAWSAPVGLAAVPVAVGLAGLLAFLLRHRGLLSARTDPRQIALAAVAGSLPAFALAAIAVVRAVGTPDGVSQVFDTPFHYNALAHIADSGDASSLTLYALGDPETPGGFYPAAWHDLTSLVVMSTGASIPVAANVVCAVITVVVWPVGCLLLVRQLFGRDVAALAVAGVLSIAFPAFPWDLFGWGVLWPNLLGMALAPAGFAAVLTVTGWVKDDCLGRGRAWLLLAITLVAAGFAHPNVVFSLIVLSLFPAGAAVFARARALRADGRARRGVVECAAFVAVVFGGWLWAATTPVLADVRNWNAWKSFETPAAAVGEVLLNATNLREALWLLSALVIVGTATARRTPAIRWVLAGHLVSGLLYVLAAALNRADTDLLTGYWYSDSHRLAAMLPITGVPLAVAGVLFLSGKLLSGKLLSRARRLPRPAAAVGLTAVLVVATAGLYSTDREARVAVTYPKAREHQLVTDEMREFYPRIAERVPEDSVVLGNPFDGSVYLWALADREVLYSHLLKPKSAEQEYLARHLDEAATDPRVCAALARYRAEYVLIGRDDPAITAVEPYGGIAGVLGARGFELVDRAGSTRLYRITACTSASPVAHRATR
ncbi:DUF6541 family protein [Saccharothrix texasensis]|uniref:DUF6541 family protein n=1 Tax=Saccharothrix texasensis TaxID=103734 RepID=UPI0011CE3226|nr:DUF6541 family protein [Saccharothrix texasensis]